MLHLDETPGQSNSRERVYFPGHLAGHDIHSFSLLQNLLVATALHGCGNALIAGIERRKSLSMLVLKG